MKNLIQKLFTPVTVPASMNVNYYPALDGLRGLSILMVLLPHFGVNTYIHPFGFFLDSNAGVQIFFVISGFIITTLLLKEQIRNGSISLKYFYIRRALRILPVAYLFLLVLLILDIAFRLHIGLFDFAEAALFFKNLPVSTSYYTAHFWTLAVEGQFYLFFPFLLILSIDYYFIISLLIVIVVPTAAIAGNYCPVTLGNLLFVKLCMYAFWKGPVMILIGSVFAISLFKSAGNSKRRQQSYYAGLFLLVIAIVIRAKTFIFYQKYISEYLFALLIGFVTITILSGKSVLKNVLSSRVIIRIGMLSYSLYIWQQLFVGPNAWQPWMTGLGSVPLWAMIIMKILAVFILALVSYAFERLFLKQKDKLKYSGLVTKLER